MLESDKDIKMARLTAEEGSFSKMEWWYGKPGECGISVALRQGFIIFSCIIVLVLIIGIVVDHYKYS